MTFLIRPTTLLNKIIRFVIVTYFFCLLRFTVMNLGNQFYMGMLKQVREVTTNLDFPAPLPKPETSVKLYSMQKKLKELYEKQEYYRRACNEVIGQLTTISLGLPDWVFENTAPEQYPQYQVPFHEERKPQEYEEYESEEDEVLNPDMLNFMLQTIKHREERDRQKDLAEATSLKLPPLTTPASQKGMKSILCSQSAQIESFIRNFYENISECREAPLWPVLPFRAVSRAP